MATIRCIQFEWTGEPLPRSNHAVTWCWVEAQRLHLGWVSPTYGDPAPPLPAGRTPGLWTFEVLEFFVGFGGTRYLEVEFGPHGHHLDLSFDTIRQAKEDVHSVAYTSTHRGRWWSGTATVHLPDDAALPQRTISVAIHGSGDARRWCQSQALPGDRPDFHQPEHWAPAIGASGKPSVGDWDSICTMLDLPTHPMPDPCIWGASLLPLLDVRPS